MTSFSSAIEAIARGEGPEDFHMYLGYAGWGPDQVEGEIGAGAWLPASFEPTVLDVEADIMWEVAYQKAIGIIPMAFTSTHRGSA